MLPPKPHLSFVGFLIILILLFPALAEAECNPNDKDSLLSFTSNLSNLNWSAIVDCRSWDGISCDDKGYRVVGLSMSKEAFLVIPSSLQKLTSLSFLNLSSNFLSGTLPHGLLSSFNNLQIIDLSYNRLSGYLPDTLPAALQVLNLSSNHFSGTIQKDILQPLQSLIALNISNNLFTGTIPPSICSTSPALVILDISVNDLTGSIPQGFDACSNLQVLSLGFNNLTGQIPTDINGTLSLQHLLLPRNSLTGEIDESITNLRSLVLFGKLFTGSIPPNIGKLSLLEKLELHINSLNGTLPLSLMNCTNIQLLNLWFNSLGGRLSNFDFSNLSQLTILDLGENQFTGELPKTLFSCKSLIAIRLAVNKLEGEISPDILELPFLSFLSLSYNTFKNISQTLNILSSLKNLTTLMLTNSFFNETLPAADISGFQNLKMLILPACNLFGQLPIWLMSLTNLEVLDLSNNNLNGTIPGWLQTLPNLYNLNLSANSLSGGFPVELTRLPALASQQVKNKNFKLPVFIAPQNTSYLQYNQLAALPPVLNLARNNLSGYLPVEIGNMQSIHILDLSHNYFSGTIPSSISNLTNLEKLDLSHNLLSGEIPSSLKSLNFLSLFNVANNNLQGSIPTGGQFNTFSDQSYEGNPGLCGPPIQKSCNNQPDPSSSSPTYKKGLDTEMIVAPTVGFYFKFGIILTCQIFYILSKRRMLPRWIRAYFIWA